MGWEGFYEVSNLGRVRTLGASIHQRHGQILKARPDKDGYATVRLHRDARRHDRTVHKLVADAFLGPCPPGLVVNHGDGDKARPALDNLEFATVGENNMHAFRVLGRKPTGPKLDPAIARSVRDQEGVRGRKELAASLGVDPVTIGDIWGGRTYREAGWPVTQKTRIRRKSAGIRTESCEP